jgi:hypothetical protein
LVLHVAVDVQRLFELGKRYPWPRPKRCLLCKSSRLWGHGYVPRYFEGFVQPLWIKRLRCPDCRTVYTLRPDLFYRGFRYSVQVILFSLMTKIMHGVWLSFLPRQNQQYWYRGLLLQRVRFDNRLPDRSMLETIIAGDYIPSSHSINTTMLRL